MDKSHNMHVKHRFPAIYLKYLSIYLTLSKDSYIVDYTFKDESIIGYKIIDVSF